MGPGGTFAALREQPFRLLWLGRVASAVGDALVPVALAFAVLSIHRSYTAFGIVSAAFALSRVVFTLAGGVIADRLSRRTIMLGADIVRAGVEAFTAAMLFTGHMTIPLFVVTGAIFGAASAFFGPASDGLVPQTITATNLQQANALLGMSRNTLNVFGPAVSGLIVAAAGPGYVFSIDAASFVASGIFLWRLRIDAPARAAHESFLAEARAGFREVLARPWVRAPIAGFAIANLALAAFIVLGPLVFLTHFEHGKTDWGIVSACGSFGAIVGALASVRFSPRHPLYAGFLTSVLLAVPVAALAHPLPWPAVALAWAFGMGSIALSNTWWETTLQRGIPEHLYSRVRSYDILVSFVFMPAGMIVVGPIADSVGFMWTLGAAAVIVAVTNLAVAAVPGVRNLTPDDLQLVTAEAV
ncbi:MAG TPA: MFS transporter [Gaiellaceae bacterium]|nr:MFS transporter [Gaiellaceae bacterium]